VGNLARTIRAKLVCLLGCFRDGFERGESKTSAASGVGLVHDFAGAFVEQQWSIGRRNERINSKLIAWISEPWKPSDPLGFQE
jgi:hypothetical protein